MLAGIGGGLISGLSKSENRLSFFRAAASHVRETRAARLVGQQLALLFVRQWLCGVILQIGRKMLRGAHPQNSDGDALDAQRELERRFER